MKRKCHCKQKAIWRRKYIFWSINCHWEKPVRLESKGNVLSVVTYRDGHNWKPINFNVEPANFKYSVTSFWTYTFKLYTFFSNVIYNTFFKKYYQAIPFVPFSGFIVRSSSPSVIPSNSSIEKGRFLAGGRQFDALSFKQRTTSSLEYQIAIATLRFWKHC